MDKTKVDHAVFRAYLVMAMLVVPVLTSASFAAGLPEADRVRVLQTPRDIPDATFTNQDGDIFRLAELRGRNVLVFFGFTNCPDVCPMALGKLRELEREGGEIVDETAFVMISVDGERDTPDVLRQYLGGFSPKFIGLTGSEENARNVAEYFSAAFYKVTGGGDAYRVSHSPQVFVVDSRGQLRAEFYNASVAAMQSVLQALNEESAR